MEGVKTWLSSQVADFFDTGMQKPIPDTSASILVVTMLRSSLGVYVFFTYNNFFFRYHFLNSSLEVAFLIALVSHA
jgi:hypothetical protein